MKRLMTSVAAVAVATVASGGLLAGFATSASAATNPPWEPDGSSVGGLTFYDASGNQITGGSINDAPIAAYVQGTSTVRSGDTKATLFAYTPVSGQAPGTWSGEALSSSTTYPNSGAPGALATSSLPLVSGSSDDENVATYEADFPNSDTSTTDGYAGIYQLRLKTSASGQTITSGYDSADIEVSGDTWSVVYPAPTLTGTTTTLTTNPTGPQVEGTSVELDASVSPAVPGTIQFEDGTTDIGTAQTVDGSGDASVTTSTLAVGSHSLHAVFTPAQFSAYQGSTGDASFTVSAPPAAGTTTALSVDPTSSPAFTAVNLTATVTTTSDSSPLPSGSGTVKFFDNGSTSAFGSAPVSAGGVATLSYSNFNTGDHQITAQFVPSDDTVYGGSQTAAAVDYTATPPASAPDEQTVDVDIPAGSLVISTPYGPSNPFHLGTASIDPVNGKFIASASFGDPTDQNATTNGGVLVNDTRAGDLPWTAAVSATDFSDGGSNTINGENLSFTGVTAVQVSGNALTPGDVTTNDVTSAAHSGAPYGTADSGSDGLKSGPHAFATTAHGFGEIDIDGQLNLDAPSSTPPGTYTATLTFTIA